jgi:chromosome transmission fidelity protein 1
VRKIKRREKEDRERGRGGRRGMREGREGGGEEENILLSGSCAGHVIPPDHLLPLVLCKGPAGMDLEFSYQTRDRENVVWNSCTRSLSYLASLSLACLLCSD